MTSELLTKRTPASQGSGEDDVRQFIAEIHRYPRLTVEQEREIAQRCARGDEDAIRQMVNSNLRLVVSVAREYAGRGVPLLDLIQEGSIGLLAAVKKFDYTLEFHFSTYATKWIRQGISRCLANHGLIRVPSHTAERIRKVIQARAELTQSTGVEPSLEELAEYCQLPEARVQQLLQLNPEIGSLDAPLGEEDGSLSDLIPDLLSTQPYEELVRRELKNTMDSLLSTLTERQQKILRLHFGMEDGVCRSLEEIGKMLEISKERVRQVEKQAMDKLQQQGASMGLEDFLE